MSIGGGDDTNANAKLLEAVGEQQRLPPELDPMVQYKLKQQSKSPKSTTKEELCKIQENIELGITPSGRKLANYSSDSGEECTYRKVECRDDSDFDLINPCVDLGPDGVWPNPFSFYWNWKKGDDADDVDEPYLNDRGDREVDTKRHEIATQLEQSIMVIPYTRIGLDDTDASDPEDQKIFSRKVFLRKRPKRRDTIISQTSWINPYYYSHRWKYYYSKINSYDEEWSRIMYRVMRTLIGTYTSGQYTFTKYPLWYWIWKKCGRCIVRRMSRRRKFLSSKHTETGFYGTMASLYGTQYIAEYDLLPNMDDPVLLSEIALEKAMEIKEKFLVQPQDGLPHVDYLKLQKSKLYEGYLEWIGMLCRFQPVKMAPRVRKVFFLNFFNVLSIHTQILRIPERENMRYLWEMKDFWEKTKALAGYIELSLEGIYHGILRCNRPHPIKQAKVFEESVTKGMPKEMCLMRLPLDYLDPRIHFALSLGTKSCPPIRIFSLYEQDCQLDEVAIDYVRTRVKINDSERTVTLPILFLWYEKDFGNNQRVMLWYLKRFFTAADQLKVRSLVTSDKRIKFKYERFNDELDPFVRRHPPSKCPDLVLHKKIIPVYWGSRL